MRREQARAGVEFGYNDFSPEWRGKISPSSSRSGSKRRRKLILGLLFFCIGIVVIIIFSILDHQPNPGIAVSRAYAYPVQKHDKLKIQLRQRIDSLIQKIDEFVEEE